MYLKPVEDLMEQIGALDFPDVQEMLPAMMHTVCLLWANSRYYCTSPRIILLTKEISNQLIRQVRLTRADVMGSPSRDEECR